MNILFKKTFLDEDDVSFQCVAQVNNKCDLLWRFWLKYFIGGFTCIMVLNYVGSMAFTLYFDASLVSERSLRPVKL